ncbi:MAG: hypothetical protein B7Y99_03030 [Caulobacterales bacterium 32-69-10]|nr:MAG: hypothetical protein B7Y99_03030 [Caulobacterales bacterium 32-69-10]
MTHYTPHGESFLTGLAPDFRRAVEASAATILLKIEPATVERLESLAAIATDEGLNADTDHEAETAFALAAELKRRAVLLRN